MSFDNFSVACAQVVQINNNESNWKEKKETTICFIVNKAKDMRVYQERKKYLVDNI